MNPGYIYLNMNGTDIDDATQQTIDEFLNDRVAAAIASQKPIILTNLVATTDPVSPVAAWAIDGVLYGAGKSFTFATGGKVTVADLYDAPAD